MACIVKRRDRWVIDFYDNTGKRRWITMPKGSTKKKATERLREIEDQLARGVYLPAKKVPLFKTVAHDWLEQKQLNVRANTWRAYESLVRRHFNEMNNLPINRISTPRVEKFIASKQVSGMNLSTLRKVIALFNQLMQYAVRYKYIDYNPVRDAERPKGQGKIKDSVIRVLPPEKIPALIDAIDGHEYKMLTTLAIFSGARQGELFGLKWSDIDWENRQIRIKRTFNGGRWYQPKTKTSKRSVDLGENTMNQLKRWKLACPPNDLDLVFPNCEGTPLESNNVRNRVFKPALKRAGLPKMRFHDLRHTFASLLLDQGESIKYVQSQLGHASPTVTLEVYADLMKPVNHESANRLEATVYGEKVATILQPK
jgi:integrase